MMIRKTKKYSLTGYLFILPSLCGVSFFVLFPFIDVIRRSFFEPMNNVFLGFSNYIELFQKNSFLIALKNTGRFIFTAIPLLLLISLILAILLQQFKKAEAFFKTIFLLPMAIPVASVVLLWKIFFEDAGLINNILASIEIPSIPFMQSNYAFTVLVITYLWKNTGYTIILWIASLNEIPISLYEASSLDGADKIKQFFLITFPNLRSAVFVIAVLSLVNSFKVFREAYLVAGNYPHPSIYMLQHIFNNWFLHLDMQFMSTAAVCMLLFTLFIILILFQINLKDKY